MDSMDQFIVSYALVRKFWKLKKIRLPLDMVKHTEVQKLSKSEENWRFGCSLIKERDFYVIFHTFEQSEWPHGALLFCTFSTLIEPQNVFIGHVALTTFNIILIKYGKELHS